MRGFVDAVVDAAAEVLDERAEQSLVGRHNGKVRTDGDARLGHGDLSLRNGLLAAEKGSQNEIAMARRVSRTSWARGRTHTVIERALMIRCLTAHMV